MTDLNILGAPRVQLIDHMGGDDSIVQAARVSVQGANDVYDVERDAGLIRYLMREKHGSPFEHNSIKFYVSAPIFVFREFQRHRIGFSYNEMSGRYSELPDDFYLPHFSRPLVNGGTSSKPEMVMGTREQWEEFNEDTLASYELAWETYQKHLDNGVANEMARIVLPVGMFSQMYVTMNLRSALSFLSLRTHHKDAAHISRPQKEIEDVAEEIEWVIAYLFPIAYKSYQDNKRVAP